jgi:hypothetical protein
MSSYPAPDGILRTDRQLPAAAPPPVAAVPPPPPPAPEEPVEAAATGGGMRDVPLGTLVIRAGLVGVDQLEDALQEGMRTGQRLGEVLTARRLIEDTDLAQLLAGQQGLPYVEAETLEVDPAAVARLPEDIARAETALVFALEDGVPVVAVADPTNELALENISRALGAEPQLVVAAQRPLSRKIQDSYAAPRPAPVPPPPTLVAVETGPEAAQPAPAPEPVAPAPVVAPAPEPVAPAPAAPPPAEQPPPAPVVVIAETPAAELEQAPEPGAPTQTSTPEPVQLEATHSVVLRLTGDDRVEVGAFGSHEEAESFARTVVGRITKAEELAEWPLFGRRFIRPQGITSVDVVERPSSPF